LFEHVLFRKTGSHFCGTCFSLARYAHPLVNSTESCLASSCSIRECIDDHHPAAADHHRIEQRGVQVKRDLR
jgi:hypothetical protein